MTALHSGRTLCSSMAAAGLQSTDVLHYESRAIRAGLKASINRLASAKGYIPSSLTPEELRQHGVPQDWSAPKVIVDFEEVRNGPSRGGMQWRVRCEGRVAHAPRSAAATSRGLTWKQGIHGWCARQGVAQHTYTTGAQDVDKLPFPARPEPCVNHPDPP